LESTEEFISPTIIL